MTAIDDDSDLAAPEVVQVQLLNADGTHTDIPFAREDFDRLTREAAAAHVDLGTYIRTKIMRTLAADRAIALRAQATIQRLRDEAAQQRAETEELRAAKKKLREALDRAKEDR